MVIAKTLKYSSFSGVWPFASHLCILSCNWATGAQIFNSTIIWKVKSFRYCCLPELVLSIPTDYVHLRHPPCVCIFIASSLSAYFTTASRDNSLFLPIPLHSFHISYRNLPVYAAMIDGSLVKASRVFLPFPSYLFQKTFLAHIRWNG